ncbi:excalibur calcium-binding domain-containing protein, partial [Modestobacter versicolor]|uniref:excalibur calcium-binding domain-containing protein n=1 Tax=Modestobacter versicolor TaxID=429133 RepID=UPI0021ABD0A1
MSGPTRTCLTLLATLGVLLVWSGPAGADPISDAIGGVTGGVTDALPLELPLPQDTAAPAPAPVQTPADLVPPLVEGLAVVPVPQPGSSPQPAAEPEQPADGPAAAAPPALDPVTLGEACGDALEKAGLPGGDECLAIAECFTLLPQPEVPGLPDLTELASLDPGLVTGLLDPTALQGLLDPAVLPAFLACLGNAIGLPAPGVGPTPVPTPGTQPALQPVGYQNCDAARAAGAAPVYAGQPGYRPELDADGDGIGCEDAAAVALVDTATSPTGTGAGQLAYTGVELTPLLAGGQPPVLAAAQDHLGLGDLEVLPGDVVLGAAVHRVAEEGGR